MRSLCLTKTLLTATICGLLSANAIADNNKSTSKKTESTLAGGQAFVDGKEEGWFWKKSPPEPPKKLPPQEVASQEKKPDEQDKAVKPPTPSKVVAKANSEEKGSAPFTVAWYRENIQKLRDRAIDEPTQENVRAYYLAQRIMLDKASQFTDMARLVTSIDPLIDENNRRSTSTFGAMDQSNEAENSSRIIAKDIGNKAGIFYFFRGKNCTLCVKQASVLNTFNYMTGIKIIPVSIDRKPLPGNIMPDWRVDTGQAAKLQITNVPALALAIPPSTTRILSFGPISADQLISRTILVAHDARLITDQQYKSTLPYNDNGYIDSSILKEMPEDYLENADEFIKYIQTKSGYASPVKVNK
ncbi:conjugal transfer protein TraF [Photorhabdus asymbiotica]|uniref:conjugal transfer protein TraF n=1 Tax=Photorhabdus asymbiotica TaxID=291112 RepID=UPI003DA728B1